MFYTTFQLSKKQALTPEGFLLCMDVPIARTGELIYTPGEIEGVRPGRDGFIRVERDAAEVFNPSSIASFIGKPVTNDHPPEMVNPLNWQQYACGTVQNVRRGTGIDDDKLLADLLITRQDAIEAVRSGKREVSCGYDAHYEEIGEGRGRQSGIIGNHTALVEAGRCGVRCSIGDRSAMTTPTVVPAAKTTVRDRLLKVLFGDANEAEAEAMLGRMEPTGANVHIHMPGSNTGVNAPGATEDGKDTKVADTEKDEPWKKTTDELGKQMAGVQSSLGMLTTGLRQVTDGVKKISDKMGMRDKDDDDDKEKTKDEEEGEKGDKGDDGEKGEKGDKGDKGDSKDKRSMKDSASLASIWTDTVSRAEILCPGGLKLGTFDAAKPHLDSVQALCQYRRTTLAVAAASTNKEAVAPFLKDKELHRMTCDAVKLAFISASELAKQLNNGRSTTQARPGATRDGAGDGKQPLRTAAEINAANAKFWENRK